MHWAEILIGQQLGTGHLGRKCMPLTLSILSDVEAYLAVKISSHTDWTRHTNTLRVCSWFNARCKMFEQDTDDVLLCLACLGAEKQVIEAGYSFKLRLTKDQEELYIAITRLHGCCSHPPSIRRLIATFPIWTVECFVSLNAENLGKWATHRLLPHMPFPKAVATARAVYGYVGIPYNEPVFAVTFKQQYALDKFNIPLMPLHVSVFWGHFFSGSTDENPILGIAQKVAHHSSKHQQQFWETVKACCLFVAHRLKIPPRVLQLGHFFEMLVLSNIEEWLCLQNASVIVRNKIALNTFIGCGCLKNSTLLTMSCKSIVQNWRNRFASVVRTFTQSEIDRLFLQTHSTRDKAMLLLLSRTGLRSNAFRTLIKSQVKRTEGVAREKGNKMHCFYIDSTTSDTISAYLRDSMFQNNSVYLFPNFNNPSHPMTVSQLRQWLHSLADRSGVFGPHVTVHSFRRYVVTALANAGNSLDLVARFVGHCTSLTTSGYWRISSGEIATRLCLPWDAGSSSKTPKPESKRVSCSQAALQVCIGDKARNKGSGGARTHQSVSGGINA